MTVRLRVWVRSRVRAIIVLTGAALLGIFILLWGRGPDALADSPSDWGVFNREAVPDEPFFFKFQGLTVADGASVRLVDASILQRSAGMRIRLRAGRRSRIGHDFLGWRGKLHDSYDAELREVDRVQLDDSSAPDWFILAEYSATEPGLYCAEGLEIVYRSRWFERKRAYRFAFGMEVVSQGASPTNRKCEFDLVSS